jgi:hypothetical protein
MFLLKLSGKLGTSLRNAAHLMRPASIATLPAWGEKTISFEIITKSYKKACNLFPIVLLLGYSCKKGPHLCVPVKEKTRNKQQNA